ncbi:MAG: hypothetical protein H0V63_10295 [Burkholderiaceae bacterium]|nr:hypothetical protein [Burkholderiaceae bacterium]
MNDVELDDGLPSMVYGCPACGAFVEREPGMRVFKDDAYCSASGANVTLHKLGLL